MVPVGTTRDRSAARIVWRKVGYLDGPACSAQPYDDSEAVGGMTVRSFSLTTVQYEIRLRIGRY